MSRREQTMRRYLLGEMTDAEREALEREYFDDTRLFERMVEAEHALVDEYARGLLAPRDRERFERHYLSHPSRRARSLTAEALAARLGEAGEVNAAPAARAQSLARRLMSLLRGPRLAWALAAALLLTGTVAVWQFVNRGGRPQEVAKVEGPRPAQEPPGGEHPRQTESEQTPPERPAAESGEERADQQAAAPSPTPARRPAPLVATLLLTVGGTRSAEAAPPALLLLTAQTEKARLLLRLRESDYQTYRAALKAAGGADVYTWERLTPVTTKSGATLALTLPARLLAEGDYVLTLRGVGTGGEVEDVSKSLFRVRRE